MPDSSDDYQLPSWPPTPINRDLWNAVMGSIASRLTAREELEADFEALIAQGTQASLDYIQATVAPQIATLQASIELAQEQIDQIVIDGIAPNAAKLGGQLPAHYATAAALALKADQTYVDQEFLDFATATQLLLDQKADATATNNALEKRLRADAVQTWSSAERGRAFANFGGAHEKDDLIINGCFDVAQRGESQTTTGYGSVDRWRSFFVGGAVTMSRQSFAAGDTLGSCLKPFYVRQSVSGQSAASHIALVQQHIEDVRSYAGQTITVLGWARRSSGAGAMVVELEQVFGAGGSATVNGIGPVTVGLSSLWQPFAVTIAVPGVVGKTIGTGSFLSLIFWTSAGSDFAARTANLGTQTIGIDLFGIHVRKGVVPVEAATYYSPPPIWETDPACMRFYFQGFLPLRGVIGNPGTVARLGAPLQIPMRRSPDIIVIGTLFDGFGADTLATLISNSSSFAAIECDFATTGTHLGQGRAAVLLNPSTVIADAEL